MIDESTYVVFYLMLTLDKLNMGDARVAENAAEPDETYNKFVPYMGKTRIENYLKRKF
jgi:hypothetical protein